MKSRFKPIPSAGVMFPTQPDHPVIILDHAPRYVQEKYIGNAAWGKMHTVALDEFYKFGLNLLRHSLAGFQNRIWTEKGEFDLLSNKAKRSLEESTLDLLASMRDNGDLWIEDTDRPAFRMIVTPHVSDTEVYDLLKRAALSK